MAIIIFNGAPNVGKDTFAHMLAKDLKFNGFEVKDLMFKEKLYELISTIRDVPLYDVRTLCSTRELKEVPFAKFDNRTPRQEMIRVSEEVMKPMYGRDYFGKVAANRVNTYNGVDHFVFSDGGFQEEIDALCQHTSHTVIVYRLTRPNDNYKVVDSRGAVYSPHGFDLDIVNEENCIEEVADKIFYDTINIIENESCYQDEEYMLGG